MISTVFYLKLLEMKSKGKLVSSDSSEKLTEPSVNPNNDLFVIEKDKPVPIRKVPYNVLLQIIETLNRLAPGDSFQINKELIYSVRKMSNIYFPDYQIRIFLTEDSYRVFRKE